MRKSKPAAMCMATQDIHVLLANSVPGYLPGFDGLQRINTNIFGSCLDAQKDLIAYIPRVDCESDPSYRQFILYGVIRSFDGKVLVYNRQAKGSTAGDNRLEGAASIGFGGHVELCDHQRFPTHTLNKSFNRELEEELYHESIFKDCRYNKYTVGIIHSKASEVDSVHLGVVVFVDLLVDSSETLITEITSTLGLHSKEPEQVRNLRWLTLDELYQEAGMESWSKFIIDSYALEQ
jgi:predicted NUDIX family phosphoesterase